MGGLTKKEFHNVIDKAEEFFSPIIKAHGAKLKVNRRWEDPSVNASASQFWGTWYVDMYGGLARRAEITVDGFALVLCHEIGHHLGGFPRSSEWAANEGQSDYYSTIACSKYIWKDELEVNETYKYIANIDAILLCNSRWEVKADKYLCYRQIMAGLSLGTLLSHLGGTGEVSIDTPDEKEVNQTNDRHPKGQCRLDTYVSGALCDVEWDISVIATTEEESAEYTCTRKKGYNKSARPRCWFKPSL